MAVRRRMQGAGIAPLAAATIAGIFKGAIVAAGTDRFSATLLYNDINYVVSVPPGTGVAMPSDMEGGDSLIVINTTANNCNVWMPIGGSIDGGTVNAPAILVAGQTLEYLCIDGQNFRTLGRPILTPTGIAPGLVGSPSTTLEITWQADGRASSALAVPIEISGSQVTSGTVGASNLAPINLSIVGSNGGIVGGAPLPTGEGGTGVSVAAQNSFLGGPSTGGSGAPAMRAIVGADLPAINLASSSSVTGLLSSVNLAPTGVTAGSGGSSTQSLVLAWNSKGQITSATSASIAGGSTSDPAVSISFTGSVTLDLSSSDYFYGTVLGNTTINVASAAASGSVSGFQIEFTSGSVGTISWPASFKFPGGQAPKLSSGKDLVAALTRDGGASYDAFAQAFLFS